MLYRYIDLVPSVCQAEVVKKPLRLYRAWRARNNSGALRLLLSISFLYVPT